MTDKTDVDRASHVGRFCTFPPIALWLRIKPYVNKFFMSPWFAAFEVLAAICIIALEKEVEGALFFLGIMLLGLVFCDDLLFFLQTMLFASVFLTNCYDSADTFMPYIRYLPIVVAAVAIHFICYRKRLHIGRNIWGGAAVAAAVTLGGLGTLPISDYFSLTSLYYVAGLGVGMLLVYIIAGAYIEEKKNYDIFRRFAAILYVMGMLCLAVVVKFYITDPSDVDRIFQPQNNLSTMMMIALPFPCYFALKNKVHLLSFLFMYAGILATGSRGGLFMGSIEVLFCIVYLIYSDKRFWPLYIVLATAFGGAVYAFLFKTGIIEKILFGNFISNEEARARLVARMKDDFLSNILFGRGLGYTGNSDIYDPVKGAMHWYHMMIPQIIGSLGLCGVAAYTYQFILRVRTVFLNVDLYKLVMGLSYLGLFLMSQVNPGEFCPIPYAMIGVLIFMMLEKYDKSRCLP